MKKEKSVKNLRKRKMLLVIPLLVLPFLTMAFWALEGGNDDTKRDSQATGLNLQLPNAELKDDRGENKLSFYEQAEKDSVKWRKGAGGDSFLPTMFADSMPAKSFGYNPYPLQTGDHKDTNEQRVYQKLAELNTHLQSPNRYNGSNPGQDMRPSFNTNNYFPKEDVDRLDAMMKNMGSQSARDPEVEQLNGMMERILDIQHPERVKQRLEKQSIMDSEQVFDAYERKKNFSISLLDTGKTSEGQANVFYSIDNKNAEEVANAIEAVIHETQSLVDGSIVKMRLSSDITINEAIIPKGSFVFGKASLQGERLHIDINSIRKENSIYPVKLFVYDLDGMVGIHIPGAIERDVAKQSVGNSLQNVEMSSIDPSFKAQATAASLNTARTLLTKKAKLIRVTVKAGYRILLKEKNTQ